MTTIKIDSFSPNRYRQAEPHHGPPYWPDEYWCGTNRPVSITSSRNTVFIYSASSFWAWGSNAYGQMGLGHHSPVYGWKKAFGGRSFGMADYVYNGPMESFRVSAGRDFIIVFDRQGHLWSCGRNDFGQCGRGTDNDYHMTLERIGVRMPVQVDGKTMLTCGEHFTALCCEKPRPAWGKGIYTWGRNNHNQLGYSGGPQKTPKEVILPDDSGVETVGAGDDHCVAWAGGNNFFVWGNNVFGKCGLNPALHGQTIEEPTKITVDIADHIYDEEIYYIDIIGGSNCTILKTLSGQVLTHRRRFWIAGSGYNPYFTELDPDDPNNDWLFNFWVSEFGARHIYRNPQSYSEWGCKNSMAYLDDYGLFSSNGGYTTPAGTVVNTNFADDGCIPYE